MAGVQVCGRLFGLLGLFSLALTGCSGDDGGGGGGGGASGISFSAPGPLGTEQGKGSFRFGAASAATQIEDQNTNTDWYVFTQPKADGGLGNGTFVGDAAKGYSKALEDVELIASLGLDSYRFSIEWARIEPKRDQIDEAALAHYDQFIDALVAKGIRPVVTLHHFSNPVWVDDPRDIDCAKGPSDDNLCGFGHPVGGPLAIEEFAEHAKLLAERYGDRVDDWGTVNEPVNYLLASHGLGVFPPGKKYLFSLLEKFVPVVKDYLKGHVAAYDAIRAADAQDADGDGVAASVGFSLSVADWVPSRGNEPSTDPEDVAARDRLVYVFHYLLADALTQGAFDNDLDGTAEESQPSFKGKLDWLGLQYYFRSGVTGNGGLVPVLALTPCFSTFDFGSCLPPTDPSYCVPTMGYEHYAPGLETVLDAFGERYPGLPLVVSEGGIATLVGERRAENIVRALEHVARARAHGVDVRGYYHWSLYDNFEWAEGFVPRFGLYQVDYKTYARTPTLGADVLGQIAKARKLSSDLRKTYGGTGPLTAEGTPPEGACKKF
ncbi:MAG: family 1 glycosylhydrolase [Polyangiaceae bacterium]